MTELEKFEAAFAALPPLPEEVRATVLVIWLEVISGHVDLPTLRELCLENRARREGNCVDAMMMELVDQLLAHCESSVTPSTAFSVRSQLRPGFQLRAGIRSCLRIPECGIPLHLTMVAQPASAPPDRIAALRSAGPRWRRRRSTTLTGETQ